LPHVAGPDTPLGRWAKALLQRAHPNVAIVAFANKLARIAWAVLRRGERFVVRGLPLAAELLVGAEPKRADRSMRFARGDIEMA
jgi:hypothetical protein